MLSRGWTDDEVKDLMGRNILRVMDEVDAVREALREKLPSVAVWDKRTDLPAAWGGDGNSYYPYGVQIEQKRIIQHDEL